MPKYFANVSDEQIEKIKNYIQAFTAHTFAGTPTGAVLTDGDGVRRKMIRPRLLMMASEYGPKRGDAQERLYKAGGYRRNDAFGFADSR